MIAGIPYAVSLGMRHTTLSGGRVCALCGKDMGQGQAPMAATLLVKWSVAAGIRLEAPQSRYVDPHCARKLRAALLPLDSAVKT